MTIATELIHLSYDGNFQLETDAKVICCKFTRSPSSSSSEDDEQLQLKHDATFLRVELQLDKTTMHPQGGGQVRD